MIHLHRWEEQKKREVRTVERTEYAFRTDIFGLYRCVKCGVERWYHMIGAMGPFGVDLSKWHFYSDFDSKESVDAAINEIERGL